VKVRLRAPDREPEAGAAGSAGRADAGPRALDGAGALSAVTTEVTTEP
jgi:hypothetical protein